LRKNVILDEEIFNLIRYEVLLIPWKLILLGVNIKNGFYNTPAVVGLRLVTQSFGQFRDCTLSSRILGNGYSPILLLLPPHLLQERLLSVFRSNTALVSTTF